MVLMKSVRSFENPIHLKYVAYLYCRCCLQAVGLLIRLLL